MASLVKNHNSYYAVFSRHGRKQWIRIGSIDKTNAKKILKELELQAIMDRLGLQLPKPTITLFEFIDKYLEYSRINKAPKTYQLELDMIKPIKAYFKDMPLNRIDSYTIEAYKAKRINDKRKPKTINNELGLIRHMLNKAKEWNYLDKTPTIKMLKLPNKAIRFLSKEELDKILSSASLWLKTIIILLVNTGIRKGELLSLKWEDVDFERKQILIHASKTNNYRIIPMNDDVYKTLLMLKDSYIPTYVDRCIPRQPKQMEYVICNEDGSKLKDIHNGFYNISRKTGIKIYPHILRHTFASLLVMNGVDLVTVKELLGHTQITTTMIYSHLSSQHKAIAIQKLNGLTVATASADWLSM